MKCHCTLHSNFSKASKTVRHKHFLPIRNPTEANAHWQKMNLVGSHGLPSFSSFYYLASIWLWIVKNHFQPVILLLKNCKSLPSSKFLCLVSKGLYHPAEPTSAYFLPLPTWLSLSSQAPRLAPVVHSNRSIFLFPTSIFTKSHFLHVAFFYYSYLQW